MFNIKGLGPDGNERLVIALSITLPIICCIVAGIMAGNNASDEAITTMLVYSTNLLLGAICCILR